MTDVHSPRDSVQGVWLVNTGQHENEVKLQSVLVSDANFEILWHFLQRSFSLQNGANLLQTFARIQNVFVLSYVS